LLYDLLYRYLIEQKRPTDHNARHAVAREIATAVYDVIKKRPRFNPNELEVIKALSK
jgi:hypothetical protein